MLIMILLTMFSVTFTLGHDKNNMKIKQSNYIIPEKIDVLFYHFLKLWL